MLKLSSKRAVLFGQGHSRDKLTLPEASQGCSSELNLAYLDHTIQRWVHVWALFLYQPMTYICVRDFHLHDVMQARSLDRGRRIGAPEACKQLGHIWAWLWKPFLGAISLVSSIMDWHRKQSSHIVLPPIPVLKAYFSARVSQHCPRALIEYSFMRGSSLKLWIYLGLLNAVLVQFGGWKPNRTLSRVHLNNYKLKTDLQQCMGGKG